MGCPLFRGCLSIEVNGRTVGTFKIVRYIMGVHFSGVSVKRGSTVFVLKIKGKPANINLSHECLKELETFSGLVVCILG